MRKTMTIDITGQRFGMVVAIKPTDLRKCGVLWECLCDCGNSCLRSCGYLRSGRSKVSCGCIWKFKEGVAARNEKIRHYKKGAESRGLSWTLSDEVFTQITQSNCFYCDIPPSNKCEISTKWSPYIYNGIDRLDNKKGYDPDNVVPCCKICNYAKHTLDSVVFLDWVRRIYRKFGWEEPEEYREDVFCIEDGEGGWFPAYKQVTYLPIEED